MRIAEAVALKRKGSDAGMRACNGRGMGAAVLPVSHKATSPGASTEAATVPRILNPACLLVVADRGAFRKGFAPGGRAWREHAGA